MWAWMVQYHFQSCCPPSLLTQHRAFRSLYTPLATNVARNTEEYNSIVFRRVRSRLEASNNTQAAPLMNLGCELFESRPQIWKRKILAGYLTSVKTEAYQVSISLPYLLYLSITRISCQVLYLLRKCLTACSTSATPVGSSSRVCESNEMPPTPGQTLGPSMDEGNPSGGWAEASSC